MKKYNKIEKVSDCTSQGIKYIIFLSLFVVLAIVQVCAQSKRSKNWVTGYSGNNVIFNVGNVTTSQGIYFPFKYFEIGNSCISDSNGGLVLASDGFNIYNKLGSYVEGGDTLIPLQYYIQQSGFSIASQSSIFLPIDSNKYYFITPTFSDFRFNDCYNNSGNCYFDLLLYNLVDMNLNSGTGKVVKRMIPLMQNANLRKTQMMACRHGNGKDWWLLKNEGDSASMHVFLFTKDSVYDKGVQIFNEPVWGSWDIRGQSTFNSDGSLFATTSHGSSTGLIFIADFDRCNGVLSDPYVIQMPWGSQHLPSDTTIMERLSVGLCFSTNNKFLYVASMNNLYQFDLTDSTWFHIAGLDTIASAAQGYETAYKGPDGKIYIGNFGGNSKQMSRIDSPDVKGAGCSFCPRCLRLDSLGANAYVGTPPCMPNYGLGGQECWPLSTQNAVEENELVVYPNPTNNLLYIKGEHLNRQVNDIMMYTLLGQMVLKKKVKTLTGKLELDISGLHAGIYFLTCNGYIKKVVIQ